jgi:hypothetical protein
MEAKQLDEGTDSTFVVSGVQKAIRKRDLAKLWRDGQTAGDQVSTERDYPEHSLWNAIVCEEGPLWNVEALLRRLVPTEQNRAVHQCAGNEFSSVIFLSTSAPRRTGGTSRLDHRVRGHNPRCSWSHA